jgi:hypothetical protein
MTFFKKHRWSSDILRGRGHDRCASPGRVVLLWVLTLLMAASPAPAKHQRLSAVPKDEDVRDAETIGAAMISVISLAHAHADVMNSREFADLRTDSGDLVILFERFDDPASLKILISLMPFKFGAGAAETLDCLLLEKHAEILPLLREPVRNDCIARFSSEARSAGSLSDLCLSDAELTEYVNSVVDRIRRRRTCSLKSFY